MLKRSITFENFDGDTVTKTYYFNLNESELAELEASHGNIGLREAMQRMIESKDSGAVLAEIKRVVLLAYGVRSDDGDRFIKNDEVREHFTQTNAFSSLFMELLSDAEKAADFFIGIIPAGYSEQVKANMEQDATAEAEFVRKALEARASTPSETPPPPPSFGAPTLPSQDPS